VTGQKTAQIPSRLTFPVEGGQTRAQGASKSPQKCLSNVHVRFSFGAALKVDEIQPLTQTDHILILVRKHLLHCTAESAQNEILTHWRVQPRGKRDRSALPTGCTPYYREACEIEHSPPSLHFPPLVFPPLGAQALEPPTGADASTGALSEELGKCLVVVQAGREAGRQAAEGRRERIRAERGWWLTVAWLAV